MTSTKPIPDRVHGTVNGYSNYRCHCQPCRNAWAAYTKIRRHKRQNQRALIDGRWITMADVEHGKPATYSNYRCQCVPCLHAWNVRSVAGRSDRTKRAAEKRRQS